jgi:hypothetical protein
MQLELWFPIAQGRDVIGPPYPRKKFRDFWKRWRMCR